MVNTLLAAAFIAASASAASPQAYDISLKLMSNGKEISSPTVVVSEGETAKLTQRDSDGTTYWEIAAKESQDQILLTFNIGKIDKHGKQTVLSSPRILAMENEPAEMQVKHDDKEVLTLSVVAKRKSF